MCAPIAWATPRMMPPEERSPERTEPADHDGLEREEEPARARGGVEGRVRPERQPRQGDGRERDRRGDAEDVAVVDAHEPRGLRVVGDRADHVSRPRPGQEVLQAQEDDHGEDEDGDRQVGDLDLVGDVDRRGSERPDVQGVAVRRERLEQEVLDDDGHPERDEERRERTAVEARLDQRSLPDVAEDQEQRQDEQERPDDRDVEHGRQLHGEERGDDRQVAVRQVDHLHRAEQEREAAREQREEPADEDALDDRVDPAHDADPVVDSPKYAASISSGVNWSGRPSSVVRPSRRHWIRDAARTA